jgi:hypothetical protein
MASCSESLHRRPSIPRRDPRKSPQASPVAGRWACNLDSVIFCTEAPRSSQRLPEAPRGPSQAGGSHTHLHTHLHLNQKSGKKLPGPAQTFFSCTIMANLPTCIISRDPSWILRMHGFWHFRFFLFFGPAVLCQNSVPKFVEVEISVCMCSPWVLPHTTFGNLMFACVCVLYEFRLRNYYDFQCNRCRTSDRDFSLLLPHIISLRLSEIPGVHRSSAYAKCETLCLPQHSVQWLHARNAFTGGLVFPAEIPLAHCRI